MKNREQFLTIKAASSIYYVSADILETLIKSRGIKPAYKCQIGLEPEKVYYSKDSISEALKYLTAEAL